MILCIKQIPIYTHQAAHPPEAGHSDLIVNQAMGGRRSGPGAQRPKALHGAAVLGAAWVSKKMGAVVRGSSDAAL
ncbi:MULTISPECIES: hypothetical protein [Sphingobium]|uniref:hypothetical protein n=1 Tax=Sphingobium TaxID=165695 RepID=UPI0011DFBA32|nr:MULTISPECIES: hypothetical protein [Sphingobium]MBJ7375734.1 hypothetical protein [Sphingobium sp.]